MSNYDYSLRPPDLAGGEVVGGGGQLTQDQVDSFPSGASGSDQLVSESVLASKNGAFEDDLSAIHGRWILGGTGTYSRSITGGRTRLEATGGSVVYQKSDPECDRGPLSIEAYIQDNSSGVDSTGAITLVARNSAGLDPWIGYTKDANRLAYYAGSGSVLYGSSVTEGWVKLVVDGPIMHFYESSNLENNRPASDEWVRIASIQASSFRPVLPADVAVQSWGPNSNSWDFSNMVVKLGN